MRKSKLVEQNTKLFTELEEIRSEVKRLRTELEQVREENNRLKEEKSQKAQIIKSPIQLVKEKVIESADESDAKQYGARAIGKVVLAVSEMTTELTKGNSELSDRQMNLILGKAEVAKSDILSVVSGDEEYNQKRIKIDSIVQKTLDYLGDIKTPKI